MTYKSNLYNPMNEKELAQWQEKYFSNIETLTHTDRLYKSPILNSPHTYRGNIVIFILIISAISFIGLSALFYFILNIDWLSNLSIGIGTGLISSIILLIFTQLKDKNINYSAIMLETLKNRHDSLLEALNYDFATESIALQNKNFDMFYDCYIRFNCTFLYITEFYILICNRLKYNKKCLCKSLNYMDKFQSIKQELDIAIHNHKNIDFDYISDMKLKLNHYLDHILHTIEEYINELEQYHLQLKYKKTKKTNRLKNEIRDKKALGKIIKSIKKGD